METITLPFPSKDFEDIWNEWIQYRKERKIAKYTPTGLKRTFNALVRDSGNDISVAIKMIEQAIEKSWQGIYPLKNNYGTNKPNQINWGIATKINGDAAYTPL